MRIIVTKTSIDIPGDYTINKGEFGVHTPEFEFDKEYEGLIKEAIFITSYLPKPEKVPILNNTCTIPAQVLRGDSFYFGAYGYKLNGDTKELVYSPTPKKLVLNEGSYQEDVSESSKIPAETYEIYEAAIQEGLKKIDDAVNSIDQVSTEVEKTGDYAKEQGDYSKTQGDYAKSQGDYAKEQGDNVQKIIDEGGLSGGSDFGIYLVNEEPTASKPFVFEGKKPGIYIFTFTTGMQANKIYFKAKNSNGYTIDRATNDRFLYIVKEVNEEIKVRDTIAYFIDSSMCLTKIEYTDSSAGVSTSNLNYNGNVSLLDKVQTFTRIPKLSESLTPTANDDLVNKKYVDDKIQELLNQLGQ